MSERSLIGRDEERKGTELAKEQGDITDNQREGAKGGEGKDEVDIGPRDRTQQEKSLGGYPQR